MTNLRYTSFALDWITAQKRAKQEAVKQVKQTSDTSKNKTTDGITDANYRKHDDGPVDDNIPVINEPETCSEKKTDEREPSKGESRLEENTSSVTGKSEEESSVLGSSVDCDEKSSECGQDDSGSANINAMIDSSESTVTDSQCNQKEGSEMEVKYSLVDMLSYCLYLPYYFTGPITTYDEFYKQVSCIITFIYICVSIGGPRIGRGREERNWSDLYFIVFIQNAPLV